MTQVLAAVKHRIERRSDGGRDFALLEPLYIARDNYWAPITDAEVQFPNNGEVVWWSPPAYVHEGSVFIVELVNVPVKDERHAAFRVDGDEQPFYVFVDMRGEPGPTEMRRKLASGGFTFSRKPVGRQLLQLAGAENEWVGPLEVEFHLNQHARWESGPASKTGFVTKRSVAEDSLQVVVIQDASTKCLRPSKTLGGPIGKFSAQTDQHLIESLLKRLRKMDPSAANALQVTKDVFHSYVTALSSAKLIDDQDELEHVREEALGLLMAKLEADATWAEATASSLVDHPNVSAKFDVAIQAKIEGKAEEIAAAAEESASAMTAQVSEKQQQMERLAGLLSSKQKELSEIDNELAIKTKSLNEASSRAAEKMSLLIDQIMADPVKELGKNALVRALAGGSNASDSTTSGGPLRVDGNCYKSLDECLGVLGLAAQVDQQSPSTMRVCLSALLSGRSIVVVGDRSSELITAFCRLIAKDYAAKVHVPTDIFGLSDFFQMPVSPVVGDGFQPINLADYFEQANPLKVFYPVVLIGANRAPMETALLDILLSPSASSSNQVAVRYGSAASQLKRIEVQRSAFFMTTLAAGESTFRPHPGFLRTTLFVDADREPAEPFAGPEGFQLPSMSISSDSIDTWHQNDWELSDIASRALSDAPDWLDGAFGTLREIHIFCQVFGNENTGVAEWLLAKYGHSQTQAELLSLAEKCGGQVETALTGILEDADIERIAAACGETN